MTLRKKTVLIGGMALLLLMGTVLSAFRLIVSAGFARVEAETTQREVRRVLKALSNETDQLKASDGDWAWWDDTYAFMADHSPAYVRANLGDTTFSTLRVSLMMFVDGSGHVAYAKAFDL